MVKRHISDVPMKGTLCYFIRIERSSLIYDFSTLHIPRMTLRLNLLQASDLLEKRSKTYSDRPVLPFVGELAGWKDTFGLLAYGSRFRRFRKDFHNIIGSPKAVSDFHIYMELEAKQFLRRLVKNPEDFLIQTRRYE